MAFTICDFFIVSWCRDSSTMAWSRVWEKLYKAGFLCQVFYNHGIPVKLKESMSRDGQKQVAFPMTNFLDEMEGQVKQEWVWQYRLRKHLYVCQAM